MYTGWPKKTSVLAVHIREWKSLRERILIAFYLK